LVSSNNVQREIFVFLLLPTVVVVIITDFYFDDVDPVFAQAIFTRFYKGFEKHDCKVRKRDWL